MAISNKVTALIAAFAVLASAATAIAQPVIPADQGFVPAAPTQQMIPTYPVYQPQVMQQPLYQPQPIQQPFYQPQIIQSQIIQPQMIQPQMILPQVVQQPLYQPQMILPQVVQQPQYQPQVIQPQFVQPQFVPQQIIQPQFVPTPVVDLSQPAVPTEVAEFDTLPADAVTEQTGEQVAGGSEPAVQTPEAQTQTVMPEARPYVNTDPLIALIEPINDGMARFRFPSTATEPISYKVNEMDGSLNPGECLAIPAGQEFKLRIIPAEGAEALTPDVSNQGEYIFSRGDAGWTIEAYTPPAPQTPPAPVNNEVGSEEATSSDAVEAAGAEAAGAAAEATSEGADTAETEGDANDADAAQASEHLDSGK